MIRPGKGSRTGATEAREESETSGACAGLGDWAAAIVRAHRHGLAQLGVLVTHLDQSGGFGALEHRRPGGRQLRRDGKLQQPCSQIAEQFYSVGGGIRASLHGSAEVAGAALAFAASPGRRARARTHTCTSVAVIVVLS